MFKMSLIRYLNSADHHQARIGKIDEDFVKKFDFKHINFLSKSKILTKLKKDCISINVSGYESSETIPIYLSKNTFKHMLIYC